MVPMCDGGSTASSILLPSDGPPGPSSFTLKNKTFLKKSIETEVEKKKRKKRKKKRKKKKKKKAIFKFIVSYPRVETTFEKQLHGKCRFCYWLKQLFSWNYFGGRKKKTNKKRWKSNPSKHSII